MDNKDIIENIQTEEVQTDFEEQENRKHKKPIRKKRKKAITHIDELKNTGIRRKVEEYARVLTRKLAIYTYAVITLVAFAFMLVTMCSVGYEGYVDGKSIGVAESKEKIESIKKSLNEEITELSGSDEGLIGKIEYKFKIVSENHYTTDEEIRQNMAKHTTAVFKGCSIYVDGTKMVTLKSKKEADQVLEMIKTQYYLEGMDCTSKILNKIETKGEDTAYSGTVSIEQAVTILNDVKDSTRGYSVVSGDTLWGIARYHETTVQRLLELNPGANEVIRVGDVLQVPSPKPVVDVETIIKDAVIEESIPNAMVEQEDPSLYIGQTVIKSYGEPGWRKVSADIVKINGIEDLSRRVLKEETIITQPVPGYIHVGTTPKPKGKGSGSFAWPLSGGYRITSRYGPRWGSVHTGLDMAISTGTPVKASDEGKVVSAGWNTGGYGNLIIVDHGNGYQTYYAHLSKIYVKYGDVVAKGETIGAVGNTGFSTGPHLHLEIRVNGSPKNPENYLP